MSELPAPPPLPPSLDLPPHLSAHKYFFVCTLTVAAWDTLVLSPRTWRLLKTEGWPVLKFLYHFLRIFVVVEFIIVGVAFFDTGFTLAMCQKFYLFEPICTAILLAVCSVVHTIRIGGIYDQNRTIIGALSGLTAVQFIVEAVCCAFYHVVPVVETQGCIAGPKQAWVGIYWVMPTLTYTVTFVLAVMRSMQSIQGKSTNYWYLMLRDNLNIYGAIWIANLINLLCWFIIKPTGPDDPVRTIVTSMAAVLTTTMTLRIILGVRGGLEAGGTFSGTYSSATAGTSYRARSHSRSHGGGGAPGAGVSGVASHVVSGVGADKSRGQTYTVDVPGTTTTTTSAKGSSHGCTSSDADKQSVRGKEAAYGIVADPEQGGHVAVGDEIYEGPRGDYKNRP